jgi:hypothetical protein
MPRILFLFLLATATAPALLAQKKTSPEPIKLDIVLTPSRNQFTAGGPVGITGTLTNTSSDSTVYVTEQSVTLMQPPELQGPGGQLGWPAFFPTEHAGSGVASLSPDSVILALKPGHGVTVQWAPRGSKDNADGPFLKRFQDWRHNLLRFLSFTPGDYPISVQAKYWTSPTLPRLDYRTADRTVSLHVLAPQSVILFGSAIGGLIAYLIFPSRRTQRVHDERLQDAGHPGMAQRHHGRETGISGGRRHVVERDCGDPALPAV